MARLLAKVACPVKGHNGNLKDGKVRGLFGAYAPTDGEPTITLPNGTVIGARSGIGFHADGCPVAAEALGITATRGGRSAPVVSLADLEAVAAERLTR